MKTFTLKLAFALLLSFVGVHGIEIESPEQFLEVTKSTGKNGFVIFYRSDNTFRKDHCQPFEDLEEKYKGNPKYENFYVAFIDCIKHITDICRPEKVRENRIFAWRNGEKVQTFKLHGGVTFEKVEKFAQEFDLFSGCVVDDYEERCTERAQAYVKKWMEVQDETKVLHEMDRLTNLLKGTKSVTYSNEVWIMERVNVLSQLMKKLVTNDSEINKEGDEL